MLDNSLADVSLLAGLLVDKFQFHLPLYRQHQHPEQVAEALQRIAMLYQHDINPCTYLVDVLQRISQHPASEVANLTPRLWKIRFAENHLRALIDPRHPDRQSKQPEATVRAH